MAAKLTWDGDLLDLNLWGEFGVGRVGMVRTRAEGIEYDYVTNVGERVVSEPYQSKEDARQECYNEVRRLLKAGGMEVE